ncbi:hypothetical protein KFE25_007860 [Diacronema lutheri]|uniref:Uncharacterized protein n=3 Tax=Diacronema lutheri TaxID=2081491 RepID=A0A8J6CBZ4_DIALT|nr:hypothetical protein KFE25_007860 [Diacronema lutheri]
MSRTMTGTVAIEMPRQLQRAAAAQHGRHVDELEGTPSKLPRRASLNRASPLGASALEAGGIGGVGAQQGAAWATLGGGANEAQHALHHAVDVLANERVSLASHLTRSTYPTAAQLFALEAQLSALQARVANADAARGAVVAQVTSLRDTVEAEGRRVREHVAQLESQMRAATERERAAIAKSAEALARLRSLEARVRDAEGRAVAALAGVAGVAPAPRIEAVAVAGARATPIQPARTADGADGARAQPVPTASDDAEPQAAAEVRLSFEFPPTQLLSEGASVYWVSELDTLELWYADVRQGQPPLVQVTNAGERWRVRDSASGNHLLSVTASERDETVLIVPASTVSVEFHAPDVRRTRRLLVGAAAAAVADGARLPDEAAEAARALRAQPQDEQPELRLFKAGDEPIASVGTPSAERHVGINDRAVGRLASDGRLTVRATAGDLFVVADSSGRVCAEHAATHELHQHVNVYCAPPGQSLPTGSQDGRHVRVEFVLDSSAAGSASVLRLCDAPRAWHREAELQPREALAVLTEPGEWWRVRDATSGRVLADVVVSAQPFQRIVVRAHDSAAPDEQGALVAGAARPTAAVVRADRVAPRAK